MSDPLYAVLVPLLSEQLGVKPEALKAGTRLYHDLNVSGDDWEDLLQVLGSTFGVNLTAINGHLHWPNEPTLLSFLTDPAGRSYYPITVSDIAEWIKAGEFRYDYKSRTAVPHRKDAD